MKDPGRIERQRRRRQERREARRIRRAARLAWLWFWRRACEEVVIGGKEG